MDPIAAAVELATDAPSSYRLKFRSQTLRILRCLVVVFAMVASTTSIALDSQLTSVTSILGELRVGITPNSVPFSYSTAGDASPTGHQIDLANQLAQDMGVDISFRSGDLESLVEELATGNIDVIMAGTPMNARLATRAAFTRPWGRTGITAVALRPNASSYRNWSDLQRQGLRIGTSGDPVVDSFFESIAPGKQARKVPSSTDAIEALAQREIDVYLTNTIEASVLTRIDERVAALFPARSALRRPLACLVRIDDPAWLHYLNTWLTIKQETGFLASLARKWGLLGQHGL